ncbi:MAG TPA: TonB-dependent receptor [Polyangiaceae bacterium]|nr:TonB-dependent receptor [Polyangiaceae bacterium]
MRLPTRRVLPPAPRPALAAIAALLAALLALAAPAGPARASDAADEADLQFQLGTERYRAGDFRNALQHFLASNRLVPNRNVTFNIARTYEQLRQYPDAFRYYVLARDGEGDPDAKRRVDESLARLAPNVAVLRVQTEPPGATVYLDRKDLGARATTPRLLGVPPGRYRVLVEKEGYEPAEAAVDAALGQERDVSLRLTPILGEVRLEGPMLGAQVRADSEAGPAACALPCALSLTPGRHTLFVTQEGFRVAEVVVEVPARGSVTVRPQPNALTGTLVASSGDVRDALVEVDGRPSGFTPAVLTAPVGRHRVRISLSGFRPVEREVEVRLNEQTRLAVSLSTLEEVSAASRAVESVEDAPASVSVISSQELREMQYPTVAEALRGTRGVYLTDDRSYTHLGFRGFARTSDYGNKVLLLVDGQPTNDNILFQSYSGFEGRTDLGDVERIEVVRGPGSVVYGTGAFFGVVNLVTRRRDAPDRVEVGASAAEYGVARARGAVQRKLGDGAGVWASVGVAKGAGRDFSFPEYAAEGGNAQGRDGFEAGTVQGRVWWRDVTVQWFLHQRKKKLPTGEYETLFNDSRTDFVDTRGFVEARFEPRLGDGLQSLTRAHANLYRFNADLPYAEADGGLASEVYRGEWAGLEQRFVYAPTGSPLRLTLGGEGQRHFRASIYGEDNAGAYLDVNRPYWVAAAYGNADLGLGRSLKLSAGARFDYFSTFGSSVNPRAALIIRPYAGGTTKLLAGKAFRAPSPYELYNEGAVQVSNTDLRPEQVYSGEVEHSHRFSQAVVGLASVYANYVTDLIVSRDAGLGDGRQTLDNSSSPALSTGAELELRRDWRDGWMVAFAYALQRTQYLDDDGERRRVPNSPAHLGSARGAVPIVRRALMAMTRLTVESPRYDRYEYPADPPQRRTEAAAVWDVVLSGEAERAGVTYALGLYNAFDWRYAAPVSSEFRQRTVVQNGRTLLVSGAVAF